MNHLKGTLKIPFTGCHVNLIANCNVSVPQYLIVMGVITDEGSDEEDDHFCFGDSVHVLSYSHL